MLRKLTAVILCVCLLMSGVTVTATAQKEQAIPSLYEAARLFYAAAGKITLHPHEETLADLNGDGEFTLSDAVKAFYLANGVKATTKPLAFECYLWQLTNGAFLPDDPSVITDSQTLNAFVQANEGFANAMWMLDVDFDTQALLAVPLQNHNSYVTSVSTDDDAVHVSLVALPMKPDIPYIAYAFITVDKEAVIGKTVSVSSTARTDAVSGRDVYGRYDCTNACTDGLRRTYAVDASENGTATVDVSYVVPSSGYAVTGMGYLATDDVLFVTCDLRIPSPSACSLSVIQTVSGRMTIGNGVYRGQTVVLCERFHYATDAVVGDPIDHTIVYQSDDLEFYGEDRYETEAELITSLEQLEAAYAAERHGSPDYTEGFDDAYFQRHALILLKPYFSVLPYGVTLDGVGVQDGALHVTVRYTNLDRYLPALYYGRLLIEVDAHNVAGIDTVVCHEEETHIQTLPQQ